MPKKHATPPVPQDLSATDPTDPVMPAPSDLPLPFDIDLIDDLLVDDDLVLEEPDPQALSLEAEEVEILGKEEPLDLLKRPGLVGELSEDPVRLYLKDIGEIDLLFTDYEFWLAARMEATRQIDVLTRTHPLVRRNESNVRDIYQALYDEALTAWKRLKEDTHRLDYPCVDLPLVLAEAQTLGPAPNKQLMGVNPSV